MFGLHSAKIPLGEKSVVSHRTLQRQYKQRGIFFQPFCMSYYYF